MENYISNKRIGFVFSTKDRVEYTLKSILSLDSESGFDIIWVDGSDTEEGKKLPYSIKLNKAKVVEIHEGIKGGPDNAIRFGLKRLLELGYDFCGLIENDIIFNPNWFTLLMNTYYNAVKDGLNVGAVTVRNLESRVLYYTPLYTINWCIGAGMILFTREAAKIILANYRYTTSKEIYKFFLKNFKVDLSNIWELWMDKNNRGLGCDWLYAPVLYKYGLISIGSIPSMAFNLDCDITIELKTNYVTGVKHNLPIEINAFQKMIRPKKTICLYFPLNLLIKVSDFRWAFIGILNKYLPKSLKRIVRYILTYF